MKTIALRLTACLIIFVNVSFAQSGNYFSFMEKQIKQLLTAKTVADYNNCLSAFEKLTKENPKEWLPYYYESYCLARLSFYLTDNKEKDETLNRADKIANQAEKIAGTNSEIYVLKSMITGMKINIDPATRGMSLGMLSQQFLEQAKKSDANNPRAFLLQGQILFYTPEAFGGGKEAALPVLEEALEKFNSYKPKSNIMPNWGRPNCEDFIAKCKAGE